MNKITKVYLKNITKDLSFIIGTAILFTASAYAFIRMGLDTEFVPIFITQTIFFMMNLYAFLQMIVIVLDMTTISDKAAGRCELMLANRMSIKKMVAQYTQITFLICLGVVVFLNVEILLISVILNIAALKVILFNPFILLFYPLLIILIHILSKSFVLFTLRVKKLGLFRRIFAFSVFLVIPIFIAINKLMQHLGIVLTHNGLFLSYILTIFVLDILFFSINKFLQKSLTKERIVLSFQR